MTPLVTVGTWLAWLAHLRQGVWLEHTVALTQCAAVHMHNAVACTTTELTTGNSRSSATMSFFHLRNFRI